MIKELETELKNKEKYEIFEDKEINPYSTDNENSNDNYLKKLRNPLSASLKIEKEKDFENQVEQFTEFLNKVSYDIENLRNKYIQRSKKQSKSFMISEPKVEKNEESKNNKQTSEEILNKSLPNFKKFVVRYNFTNYKFIDYF